MLKEEKMERKFSAILTIKHLEVYDWGCNKVSIELFRKDYDKREKDQYNFNRLIQNYCELDDLTANHLEDYILRLFTMEEIKQFEGQLTVTGEAEIDCQEINFPIDSTRKIPWLLNSKVPRRGCYEFNRFGVCGYYYLNDFEVFKRINFESRQEKIECISEMIFGLEVHVQRYIFDMFAQEERRALLTED